MKKLLALCMTLFLCWPVTGCTEDDFLLHAFKTLSVAGDAYDAAMQACGQAYRDGLLGEEGRERVERAGRVYAAAYQAGVQALSVYYAARSPEARADAEQAVQAVSGRLGELMRVAWELGVAVKQGGGHEG